MAYIGNVPTPDATQVRDSFTATSGQTTFTTTFGYSPGFVDVFLNGLKLAIPDYTALDGSTVVLSSGANANDLIEITSYSAFAISGLGTMSAQNYNSVSITGGSIDVSTLLVNGAPIVTDVVGDTTPQLGGDLDLNGNNITGNGTASFTNAGTGNGVFIDQDGNGRGLAIDHEGTTQTALHIDTAITTGNGLDILPSAITSGYAQRIYANSAGFTGNLLRVHQNNASGAGYCVNVINDGTGDCLFLDQNGSGNAIRADGGNIYVTGGDIVLGNNRVLKFDDSGGTARPMFTYTAGNVVQIGSSANVINTGIEFFPGGTVSGANKMTLTTDGSLNIATSLGVGTSGSGTTGEIRATNNITAYYSDERLKNFEGAIPNALEKVKALTGYYFTENETAKSLGYDNPNRQVGLSAQEVEKVLPEVVTEAPISAEYKTVYYEKLIPLLVEAIKELSAKVEG